MVGASTGVLDGGAVGCVKGGMNMENVCCQIINYKLNYYSFGSIDKTILINKRQVNMSQVSPFITCYVGDCVGPELGFAVVGDTDGASEGGIVGCVCC